MLRATRKDIAAVAQPLVPLGRGQWGRQDPSTQAATVPDVLAELEKSSERIPLELIAHGLGLGGAEAASGTTLKLGSIVVEHMINELLATAKRRKLREHDSEVILDAPDDAWAAQLAGAGSRAVPVRAEVLLERAPLQAEPAADGTAARPRGRR
ncbi:hypothetical protein FNF29_07631 [Cafeteria roenbergensis]|uniref:Uncharacterized protein n=1 Tax=Cafeteria roenbergensis TaxID=33653 RepID=A0A5A8C2Q0_CAFRO|nr:hypothetical protein FNF29_07631 [Cafeteria roenbergensis]|eukprot:KAA0147004.1 hypothetical protein FNF29_07631 [Cafeteria roenbergensis]